MDFIKKTDIHISETSGYCIVHDGHDVEITVCDAFPHLSSCLFTYHPSVSSFNLSRDHE